MTTTEFPIDLETNDEGLGTLFITDAALLVRPRRVPGQYPASAKHDSAHAYGILNLGNDMGQYQWHIICHADPRAAHQMLDRVFYAYVDACCLELWCDARVCYIVNGKTIKVEEYGFEDGNYTMIFNVYCNVAEDGTEDFLTSLTSNVAETERFVMVRPDSSEYGYAARGFTVDQSPEDDFDDDSYDECQGCGGRGCERCWDDEDNEDPLAGDVDPTGGYYEPEEQPWGTPFIPLGQ